MIFLIDSSDHFPIAIIVERKNKKQGNIRCNKQSYFFRNYKKFNYDSFVDNLQSSINNFRHSLSCNVMKLKNHFQILLNLYLRLLTRMHH